MLTAGVFPYLCEDAKLSVISINVCIRRNIDIEGWVMDLKQEVFRFMCARDAFRRAMQPLLRPLKWPLFSEPVLACLHISPRGKTHDMFQAEARWKLSTRDRRVQYDYLEDSEWDTAVEDISVLRALRPALELLNGFELTDMVYSNYYSNEVAVYEHSCKVSVIILFRNGSVPELAGSICVNPPAVRLSEMPWRIEN